MGYLERDGGSIFVRASFDREIFTRVEIIFADNTFKTCRSKVI